MSLKSSSSNRGGREPIGRSNSSNRIDASRNERQTNFKVVVRIRPPLPRELHGAVPFNSVVAVDSREQVITVSDNLDAVMDERGEVMTHTGHMLHSFVFDYVYDQSCTQKKVYETSARPGVDSALQGYNATIFAYGQTGTGKTFTMEGFNSENTSVEARGIIPRAIEQVFGHIQRNISPRMRFLVRASYLQIYNEQISDLLKNDRTNLLIREDKKKGVYVEGLSEWVVRSPAEIYGLMEKGGAIRATGETKMNEMSSRSHAVFIVIVEQSETIYADDHGNELSADEFNQMMYSRGVKREVDMKRLEDQVRQSFKIGKLNLVDLAGSERIRLSGATGQRLEESKQINLSLSALGNVISALTETKGRSHIPYRDSKLTRMLEDSLGGNCKTTMMAMISPAGEAITETLSTLKFANRAKNIKNEAKVNEDLDQKSLLRKYERELKKLRAELEERSKNVVDKRRLLELDEQRKRAEADKMAAIQALEKRSREFLQEKEEKKKLEQRIAMLMSQMIRGERGHEAGGSLGSPSHLSDMGGGGGGGGANGPEIQVIMKEQHDRLRQEYEGKLADLERERESIVEEKAQVDRYKQLLLKQRDIMIALTQRLVERDEQIVALQDELDAYDKHHKELEEKLDEKTAKLIHFQRIAMEVNAALPPHGPKTEELSRALEMWSRDQKSGRGGAGVGGGGGAGATELMTEDEEISLLSGEERSRNRSGGGGGVGGDKRSLEEFVRKEWSVCLNRLKREEARSGGSGSGGADHRFVESSYQLMADMVTRILEQINSSGGSSGASPPLPSLLLSPNRSFTSASAASDRYEELISENKRLSLKIKDFAASSYRESSRSDEEIVTIRSRCETLVKERQAVHTIMEQKIKVLVQSVAQAVSVVLHSSQGGGPTGHALAKDVAALQRLVNASIAALRNAASVTAAEENSSNGQGQGSRGGGGGLHGKQSAGDPEMFSNGGGGGGLGSYEREMRASPIGSSGRGARGGERDRYLSSSPQLSSSSHTHHRYGAEEAGVAPSNSQHFSSRGAAGGAGGAGVGRYSDFR